MRSRLHRRTFLAALVAAPLAASCSGPPRIRAVPAKGASFAYRTFSFSTRSAKLPDGFSASNVEGDVRAEAERILTRELLARGYVVDDEQPELEIVVASGHRANRFRMGGGMEWDPTVVSDETLVVEVWDLKEGDIVWEGRIDGTFDHGVSHDMARTRRDLVELVRDFPRAPR